MFSGVIGLQDAVVEGVKTALNQWKAEIGFYFYFINLELASTVIYFRLECMETALIYGCEPFALLVESVPCKEKRLYCELI